MHGFGVGSFARHNKIVSVTDSIVLDLLRKSYELMNLSLPRGQAHTYYFDVALSASKRDATKGYDTC